MKKLLLASLPIFLFFENYNSFLSAQNWGDFCIKFPDDIRINQCNFDTSITGQVEVYSPDNQQFIATFEDQFFFVVPDASLKIEREWTIINPAHFDPSDDCVYVPNFAHSPSPFDTLNFKGLAICTNSQLMPPWPLNYSQSYNPLPGGPGINFNVFFSANANCYQYRQIIYVIDSLKPVAMDCTQPVIAIADSSSNDPWLWNDVPDIAPFSNVPTDLPEAPVELKFSATDGCLTQYLKVRCMLYLDLDGDGVKESVFDSKEGAPTACVYFENVFHPEMWPKKLRFFDQRPVPGFKKYTFKLMQKDSADVRQYRVVWAWRNGSVNPQLPAGKHRIEWIVEDLDENRITCKQDIIILANKPASTAERNLNTWKSSVYPNPFANETNIFFNLKNAADVRLTVFDTQGRLVFEKNGFFEAGENAMDLDANDVGVASGLLYFNLNCGEFVERGTLLRVR